MSSFIRIRRKADIENWTPSYKKNRVILRRTKRSVAQDALPFVSIIDTRLILRPHLHSLYAATNLGTSPCS